MRIPCKPRPLRPGGTLALVAPAGPMDAERLRGGEALLHRAGLRTCRADDLLAHSGYLAGDDRRRARELMEAVRDPQVDAIVCVRGGYGCHRIVSELDAGAVRRARKPLLGFSDATTLLLWQLRRAGLMGFHGPMLERGEALPPDDLDAALALLMGRGAPEWRLAGRPGGGGRARGRLVGGSLSLVVASLGTPWEIDTRGAILLFEDVNEPPYRIDRMLSQLREAGKLTAAAGVGVGHLHDCQDPRYPEPCAADVVAERLAPLGVPFVTGLPFGHTPPNRAWPLGARAAIDGAAGVVDVLERGVEDGEQVGAA